MVPRSPFFTKAGNTADHAHKRLTVLPAIYAIYGILAGTACRLARKASVPSIFPRIGFAIATPLIVE
jgi:hypothetical protein